MEKGTVYFFTGLAGAGKTTIGGMFYRKLKEIKPDAVLFDGDAMRKSENTTAEKDYSTEARRNGAYEMFRRCKKVADQGTDCVYCGIAMYGDVRAWCRENIENYREIYIKVGMETLYKRNQKGLYSPGAKQVVGVDLPWDEPQTPDVVIENDKEETPEIIVEGLLQKLYIIGRK
ncbi:adenylyl-sulfate kinase [bacterium D16-76]|nr:adenylyl-sulfate kinase [bacterium D16-76]